MTATRSDKNAPSQPQDHENTQIVAVTGAVITAMLALYAFLDLDRFFICLFCGFLVLGGYMIRCPASEYGRVAKIFRIGVIAATIGVPTLVLTSGRLIDEMPSYLESAIRELSPKAHYADIAQARIIEAKEGPSRIIRWVPNLKRVAVLETETLGQHLSERIDSIVQTIFWAIVFAIILVLVALVVGNRINLAMEASSAADDAHDGATDSSGQKE